TDSGQPTGQPNATAWLFDLDTGNSTRIDVAAGSRVGHVLAATYRFEDHSFYVIDVVEGVMQLKRWSPNGCFAVLARFPSSYGSYGAHWLEAGPGGDLIYVGTRPEPRSGLRPAALQRFVLADGRVVSGGSTNLGQEVLYAPAPTIEAVTLVV